jgi:hypothetical protein
VGVRVWPNVKGAGDGALQRFGDSETRTRL